MLLMVLATCQMNAQDNVITFDVGSSTVSLLSERQLMNGTDILIGATEEMIKQAIPNGTYPMAMNVFLVEMDDKIILIDAGLGEKTIENLELYGKKASDIDAIFITHLHGDHIGSLILNDVKSYPKAKLYISKPEYDYYMNEEVLSSLPENRRDGILNMRKLLNTYKEQLIIFTPGDMDNANELIPGLKGIAAYGHTPGHTGYMLESEGSKLFFWGDLTHAMAIQMPFPEVALSYDSDTAMAIACRKKLLQYASDNDMRIAGAHIPFPGIGFLSKNATNGYSFTMLCSCEGKYPSAK
jgi:glyoxylase-like metal-dependent hydrolase (beta-lactamase superfamily II)